MGNESKSGPLFVCTTLYHGPYGLYQIIHLSTDHLLDSECIFMSRAGSKLRTTYGPIPWTHRLDLSSLMNSYRSLAEADASQHSPRPLFIIAKGPPSPSRSSVSAPHPLQVKTQEYI